MPRRNEWQHRFGAKRRAMDRALLAEFERELSREEKAAAAERQRIAQAFGRPLDPKDC
jgi:hypothetical protein